MARNDVEERKNDLLVRIGDAETSSQLPNKSDENAKLEEIIAQKKKLLASIQQKLATQTKRLEKIHLDRRNVEGSLDQLRHRKAISEREVAAEERSAGKAHIVGGRLQKELVDAETHLKKLRGQIRSLTEKQRRLQGQHESVAATDETSQAKKLLYNSKLKSQELLAERLERTLTGDAIVAKELEAYMSKLTRQVFDQQRRVDALKMGLPMEPGELEEARRILRDEHKKFQRLRGKISSTLKTFDSSHQHGSLDEGEVPTTGGASSSAKERRRLLSAIRRRNTEIGELERKWINLQDKLSKCEMQLAETQTKKNLGANRLKRYQTKVEILKLEPTPTMYRSYEDYVENAKKGAKTRKPNSIRKELESRKTADLEKTKQESSRLERKMQSLTDKLQKSVRDVESTDSSDIPSAPSDEAEFQKLDQDREKFVASTTSQANHDLEEELKDIESRTSKLEVECSQAENKLNSVKAECQFKKSQEEDVIEKIATIKKEVVEAKKIHDETIKKLEAEMLHKETVSRKELEELTANRDKRESERNALKSEMHTLKTSNANFAHKHATFVSWKKSRDVKGFNALGEQIDKLQAKVESDEKEMERMRALAERTRERNAPVKHRLGVVKSYRPEMSTLEDLQRQLTEISRLVDETRSRQKITTLERDGHLQFES